MTELRVGLEEAFPTDRVSVHLIDEYAKEMVDINTDAVAPFAPSSSAYAGAVGFAVEGGKMVVLQGELVMVDSTAGDRLVDVAEAYVSPRDVTFPSWVPEGTEALLVAPIAHDIVLADQIITEACCAIARGGDSSSKRFANDETMVVRLLVAVAASALANVWNTEEAIVSANAREALVHISTLVGSFQDRSKDADMSVLLHQASSGVALAPNVCIRAPFVRTMPPRGGSASRRRPYLGSHLTRTGRAHLFARSLSKRIAWSRRSASRSLLWMRRQTNL